MKAKGIIAVLVVGLLCSVASAAIWIPIDDTGWSVGMAQPFVGKVTVVYDETTDDAIVIELRKTFNVDAFEGNRGMPIWLDFKLVNSQAPNYRPIIEIADEYITNETGRDWYDFHIVVAGDVGAAPYVGFDAQYIFEGGVPDYNPFETVVFDSSMYVGLNGMPTKVDMYNGVVPDDGDFLPGFAGANPETNKLRIVTDMDDGMAFTLKEWPTIPEPTTLGLLGMGLVGLVRRRRS